MIVPNPKISTGILLGTSIAGVVVAGLSIYKRAVSQKWVNACISTFGELDDNQQSTIRRIVHAFNYYGDGDVYKLAYILATVDAECSFESKREYRTSTNVYKEYWTTNYMGRGLVQLTHKSNYLKASNLLGVDFVSYPDKVMELRYAVPILVQGMMTGMFTRKKLGDYINEHQIDLYNARRVINGLDKASSIADAALSLATFYES
jgi:hypothetical protein